MALVEPTCPICRQSLVVEPRLLEDGRRALYCVLGEHPVGIEGQNLEIT